MHGAAVVGCVFPSPPSAVLESYPELISMNRFLMEGPGGCLVHVQKHAEVVRWGLIFAGCRNVFGVSSENSSVLH